ncbi:hypothetical protein KUTeg_003598 [Tegillarca granosa]|uniref:Ion transport domain-containing protein n=1 Tax=Tegillarca granosa TaxID=220873 RepID=A0ABQ9FRE2_TEGGR|nr:hypothetical protein KUTeg_003598 [Tegillarca granosa]
MAKGIRALLDTVIQALPQVGNLGLLFFLLFFIFAALGVELFGRLECSEEHPCEGLGKHAHFKDFGMAFLTLFRVATGDNWNGIMKDTLRHDCDDSDNCLKNCCVSSVIAPVFFVVFVLMAQFVLVNVVVAVLMKHLEATIKIPGTPIPGIHLVPIDITVSNYGSTNEVNLDASGSSIEIPPTPSSCFSDNSSYLETNLDHSSSTLDTKTTVDPNKRSVSPQHKQRFKDRKLVRQKKCDYESPPIPVTSDDKIHPGSALGVSTPNPTTPVPKKVFQSQPSLNIPLEEWKDLLYQEQETNLNVKPHHPLKRLCSIQRSQSSGAERVRVREKFLRRRRQLHSNPSLNYTRNRHASQSLSKEDILILYRNKESCL